MLLWNSAQADKRLKRTHQDVKCCLKHGTNMVVLHSTSQLVDLMQRHSVPFMVEHARRTPGRTFRGLVTAVYSKNNRLCFKVLYPYTEHLSVGVLYPTLSAASSKMYADYSAAKSRSAHLVQPVVRVPNSNGWEHLCAQINCDDGWHDHGPHAFCLHLNYIMPPLMRERLTAGEPAQFNTAWLPKRHAVQHTLDLDHLMPQGVKCDKDAAEHAGSLTEAELEQYSNTLRALLQSTLQACGLSVTEQGRVLQRLPLPPPITPRVNNEALMKTLAGVTAAALDKMTRPKTSDAIIKKEPDVDVERGKCC